MRILFVGSSFDVQTTYWIKQINDQNWDIHIFDPKNLIHPELKKVTIHTGWAKSNIPESVHVKSRWPFKRGKFFMKKNFTKIWKMIVLDEVNHLGDTIKKIKPDIIHILGAVPYGLWFIEYFTKLIQSGKLSQIPWIYQCKGSDISYSENLQNYSVQLKSLHNNTQYYIANCNRDYELAKSFGFTGKLLGLFQGMGAYPIDEMQIFKSKNLVYNRNIIAVKGLYNNRSRADIAIEALSLISEHLKEKKIVFYQVHSELIPKIKLFKKKYGLDVEIFPRSSPWEIFKLFGDSMIAIGISHSDGIPNAMIEAMVMGAFPIQTNPGNKTSEWIIDGENGFLINNLDAEHISKKIIRALNNKSILIKAEKLNNKITRERIDKKIIKSSIIDIYKKIFNEHNTKS